MLFSHRKNDYFLFLQNRIHLRRVDASKSREKPMGIYGIASHVAFDLEKGVKFIASASASSGKPRKVEPLLKIDFHRLLGFGAFHVR